MKKNIIIILICFLFLIYSNEVNEVNANNLVPGRKHVSPKGTTSETFQWYGKKGGYIKWNKSSGKFESRDKNGNLCSITAVGIGSSIVTFENLNANGDIGTGTGQLTEGSAIATNFSDLIDGTTPFTSINIDSGAIDGVTMATSDITVGAGKALDVSAGTLTLANDQISGDKINGGTIGTVTISQLAGALDANSQTITNVNIDSGAIDGVTMATSDITVGAGKALDVSAGTLTLANDQISGDKINGGTIGTVTIGQLAGALDANSQTITNVNIDSGAIDGVTMATSDITVGAGKALDVSAGTLTLANDQISGDKINGGTIGTVTISQLAGALDANNQAITNVDINSGTIEATIGATTPNLGVFTTGEFTGNVTLSGVSPTIDATQATEALILKTNAAEWKFNNGSSDVVTIDETGYITTPALSIHKNKIITSIFPGKKTSFVGNNGLGQGKPPYFSVDQSAAISGTGLAIQYLLGRRALGLLMHSSVNMYLVMLLHLQILVRG